MKRILTSLITGMASVAFTFSALQFESQSHLSSLWQNPENRTLIEARVKLNQTALENGVPKFFEEAYSRNVLEIGKYSSQVQCASGKDTSKCLPGRKH